MYLCFGVEASSMGQALVFSRCTTLPERPFSLDNYIAGEDWEVQCPASCLFYIFPVELFEVE